MCVFHIHNNTHFANSHGLTNVLYISHPVFFKMCEYSSSDLKLSGMPRRQASHAGHASELSLHSGIHKYEIPRMPGFTGPCHEGAKLSGMVKLKT